MTEVSREEFTMLKDLVNQNSQRISEIDNHGTRGVQSVQVQLNEVIKDLADLKNDVNNRFAEQRKNRHWIITTAIGLMMGMGALAAGMVDVLIHVHA